jgi:hypothetical protein
MDVDLLSAESICPRTQGVARALRILDTLHAEHAGGLRMTRSPWNFVAAS